MDDKTWMTDFAQQWPTFAWLVPIFLILFYVVKFLAIAHDPVAKVLGSVGRGWQEKAERKQKAAAGELGLLREEVRSLSDRVDGLQKRDEIYWAYVIYDEQHHREDDFSRVQEGRALSGHMSFLQFRAQWLRDRGRHEDLKEADTY